MGKLEYDGIRQPCLSVTAAELEVVPIRRERIPSHAAVGVVMKSKLRFLWIALGVILSACLLGVAYILISYPIEYLRRTFSYMEADVNDYQIFPERAIQPAENPVPFRLPADPTAAEAAVRAIFEQNAVIEEDLESFLRETGTQALLVIRDDTLLYEGYFNGASRESIVTSFSVAKSFVSTLFGIAESEGLISSMDDPITHYLPELLERDPHFADITIRHLLNMTSGIHYVETSFVNGDDALTYYYPDLRELALQKTSINGEPGKTWLYNNYHPLLLGIILERVTGMPVAEYLEAKVWQPMGAEYPASWSLDSEESAFEKMESGINARAVDFAKLGRLYLNGGSLNGQQIVPQTWVEQATRMDASVDREAFYIPYMSQPFGEVYHQLLWWGVQQADGDHAFAARGNHGQDIFVYPAKNLIIVRNSQRYGLPSMQWLNIWMDFAEALPE